MAPGFNLGGQIMFRISSVCIACCLAGCVSTHAVYPVTWAGREKLDSGQCPNIDGEYSNLGDLSQESDFGSYSVVPGSVSLAHLLSSRAEDVERLNFTSVDATTDEHTSVSLRVADGSLHVIAKHTDGSQRAFDMPLGDECSGSMIDAGSGWDGTTTILASSVDRSSMKLGRAEDGSLLLRTNQSMGWFITYVPVFGTTESRWIRFPAFRPEPESPGSVAQAVAE
jgi:hypothetical protein